MYQKERKQQILYLLQEKNEMTVCGAFPAAVYE